MKSILKQFWALIIIAVLLITSIGYFATQKFKDVVKGLKVDGKDVVASIDGYQILADDLYQELLNDTQTDEMAYIYYEYLVVAQTTEVTDEIKEDAKSSVESTIEQFKEQYGDNYEDYLNLAMRQEGLKSMDDLEKYFIHYLCLNQAQEKFFEENREKLFTDYTKDKNARIVSHILVEMSDPDKPTEEEQEKLDEVKEEIKKGTPLNEIAEEYSDDGSATSGGKLGIVDKDEQYVEEFKKAMLDLDKGEAKWVKTEYGWHYIWVNETDVKEMLKETEDVDTYLANKISGLGFTIIEDLAKDAKIEFKDEVFKEKVERYINANKGGNE